MNVFKQNGVCYLVSRADWLLYDGDTGGDECKIEENSWLWKAPGDDGIICGCEGGFESSYLRYDPEFVSGEINMKYLMDHAVPHLKDLLGRFGKIDSDGKMDNEVFIAQRERAFVIQYDFGIMEVETPIVSGRYRLYEFSYLKGPVPEDTDERIRGLGRFLEKTVHIDYFPFAVMDTATCKWRLIGKEEPAG